MLKVIINADDFGLNKSRTEAIAQSFRTKLITNTTMIANGMAFNEAVQLGRAELSDKVGIHFNLTEGKPLTENIKLFPTFCSNGFFHGKINRIKSLNILERQAVYEELSAQCHKIIDAGIRLTHADSHHHIHTGIFIAPIVFKVCRENGIKTIRLHRNIGSISGPKRVVKALYNSILRKSFKTTDYMGDADDIDLKKKLLGTVEIMVHPDFNSQGEIIDRRGNNSTLLDSIKYWNNSEKISYSQL